MSNLIYSVDLIKCYAENPSAIDATISFLNGGEAGKFIPTDEIEVIGKIREVLDLLKADGPFMLSDKRTQVNFLYLTELIKTDFLREACGCITVIKAELLALTTPDTLEEFKQLYEFWDVTELFIRMILD